MSHHGGAALFNHILDGFQGIQYLILFRVRVKDVETDHLGASVGENIQSLGDAGTRPG